MFGQAIDQQHGWHHHHHETDQQPAHLIHADLKRVVAARFCLRCVDPLGQSSHVGLGARTHDNCRGAATDHAGSHEQQVAAFQWIGVVICRNAGMTLYRK